VARRVRGNSDGAPPPVPSPLEGEGGIISPRVRGEMILGGGSRGNQTVMPGYSRSKNGVALLAYLPGIRVFGLNYALW